MRRSNPLRHPGGRRTALLAALAGPLAACSQPTPEDAEQARVGAIERAEALPDSIPGLIQARVPAAVAGDSGWAYTQRANTDLDGDGADETVVLICDVGIAADGAPMWEDGHRWQVYVQEPDGRTTRLYARFLPHGTLTADLVVPEAGSSSWIVLLEQTPFSLAVYEFRYRGPGRVEVRERLNRRIDVERRFEGAPRP